METLQIADPNARLNALRTNAVDCINNDVRLAVKNIINREEWFEKIIFGYGEIGNDSPVGPANIYRATAEALPQRIYDPDKAKYHLKQAGMENLSIKFHAAETALGGAVNAGQLMQESARPAGLDIEVVREPAAMARSSRFAENQPATCMPASQGTSFSTSARCSWTRAKRSA